MTDCSLGNNGGRGKDWVQLVSEPAPALPTHLGAGWSAEVDVACTHCFTPNVVFADLGQLLPAVAWYSVGTLASGWPSWPCITARAV